MGIEIKQMLERDFDITMDAKNIRALTFPQLDDLSSAKSQPSGASVAEGSKVTTDAPAVVRYQLQHLVPAEPIVKMNNVENANAKPIFVITPIDGSVLLLEQVMSHLNVPVYGLQCTELTPLTSIPDLASEFIKASTLHCSVFCIPCKVNIIIININIIITLLVTQHTSIKIY